MTASQALRRACWLLAPLILAGAAAWSTGALEWQPRSQDDLLVHSVYAYRQWQSTGIYLNAGDRFTIQARGEWLYSPYVGLHGPEGGQVAPPNYPEPGVRGGALIGRVGEDGEPFPVGSWTTGMTRHPGLLYLGINDDLLGDNHGELSYDVGVTRGESEATSP